MSQPGNQVAEAIDAEAERRQKAASIRPFARMWPFVMAYRGMAVGAVVALLAATMITLLIPMAIRRVIDNGFSGDNAGFIDQYFLALIAVAAGLAVASASRFYFVSWIGERVVADLRTRVYDHVTGLSPTFYEVTRTGEVLSRLTADTTLIKTVVGSTVSIALRNLFLFFGAAAMLIYTSVSLSGLVLLALPLIALPLIALGRWVRRLSRDSQDRVADTSAHASESLNAIQTVQAFTHEAIDRQRFGSTVERSFETARRRVTARAILTALIFFLVLASIVCVLWAGAQFVLSGQMTGGELGQFILYAVFAGGALGALSEVWGELQLAAGATERLMELLDTEPDIVAPARPSPMPQRVMGNVVFDEVSFAYPSRPDQSALHEFNLRVKPGERVALVGPSGAGKSTVFQLLERFYDPQGGLITIDGAQLREADPSDVRRVLSLVPQDPYIFGTSIRENIAFGRPDATDAEIATAAKAACADEFIQALPLGYDTEVGERGIKLSGGQRQRIAIARAILRDAPILLLDEATSALDAESEHLVQQALDHLMQDRTTIVIAHRLATVLKADRIIVMDQGQVVAEGTHGELVAAGGLYQRLARLQFGDAMEGGPAVAAG